MITQAPCPLLDIPTELLVRILSNLSCDDLCLLQGTCRRFRDIIFGTPYLEYLLHTGIDNVDDLLPPDVPFPVLSTHFLAHGPDSRLISRHTVPECTSRIKAYAYMLPTPGQRPPSQRVRCVGCIHHTGEADRTQIKGNICDKTCNNTNIYCTHSIRRIEL